MNQGHCGVDAPLLPSICFAPPSAGSWQCSGADTCTTTSVTTFDIVHGGAWRALQLRHYDRVGKYRPSRDRQGYKRTGKEEKGTLKCILEQTEIGNGKTDKEFHTLNT